MSENTSSAPLYKSRLSLFRSLLTGKFQPGRHWQQPEYRVKFFFRSLVYARATAHLFSAIITDAGLRALLPLQHTMPSKIHRPYLYLSLPAMARSEAIISHYHFARQLAPNALRFALLTNSPKLLAEFLGKNGEQLAVTLVNTGRCEREGEANLFIHCNGVQLAMLTFAVIEKQNQRVLLIGGIQGAHRDTPHEVIRDATKACFGLFPKRLLIEVVQMFAAASNIRRIEAVGDHGHVFRSLRYRLSKKSLFHASYDEFWTSLNAERISDELYALPLRFERKPVEEIASKKRSEYRKRYELLDAMQESFNRQLV